MPWGSKSKVIPLGTPLRAASVQPPPCFRPTPPDHAAPPYPDVASLALEMSGFGIHHVIAPLSRELLWFSRGKPQRLSSQYPKK